MKFYTHNIINLIIYTAIVFGALFFTASFAHAQNYTAPTTAPTALPAGSTPQENFYHFVVQSPIGGTQVKIGKLGLNEEPLPQYDFRSDGLASFLSGAWASSGSFARNVCIGRSNQPSMICPQGTTSPKKLDVYGEFISQGQQANIQNDTLRHTTLLPSGDDGVQRVCSTQQGILRLCNMPEGVTSLALICMQFPEYYGCSTTIQISDIDTSINEGPVSAFEGVATFDATSRTPAIATTQSYVDLYCSDPVNSLDELCGGSGDTEISGRPINDNQVQSIPKTQDLQKTTTYFENGTLTQEGQTRLTARMTESQARTQTDDALNRFDTTQQISQDRTIQGFFEAPIRVIEGLFRRPQRFYRNLAIDDLREATRAQSEEQIQLLNTVARSSVPIINNRETDVHRALQQHTFDISGVSMSIDDILVDGAALDCNSGPVTCNPPYCNSVGENHHYVGTTNAAGTVCNLSIGMDQNDDAYPLLLNYIANN